MRYLLVLPFAVLPLVLIYSSVRAFGAIDSQRAVYLRNRAASIAARLETLPSGVPPETLFESLREEERSFVGLRVFSKPDDGPREIEPLWSGRELFRMGFVRVDNQDLYRAFVPFHAPEGLRVARIDLAGEGADFLILHARHNVIISSISGIALAALALFALWSVRQKANLEKRQMTLEHMAQLGQMAAALAHEIRNPLGTMKGFAQLANENAGPEMCRLLAPVVSEAERLERLVNDLLLYGRPPAPTVRTVYWRDIQHDLEANASRLIGERPIRFNSRSSIETLYTDPDLLRQVLLNLLRNAVEAIDGNPGKICLDARMGSAKAVKIAITDDGPGIPAEARTKLFDAFFTTKPSGTGLGLAICRKIATALGGKLEIRDVEPHGVNAVLQLPVKG